MQTDRRNMIESMRMLLHDVELSACTRFVSRVIEILEKQPGDVVDFDEFISWISDDNTLHADEAAMMQQSRIIIRVARERMNVAASLPPQLCTIRDKLNDITM